MKNLSIKQQEKLVEKEGWTVNGIEVPASAVSNNWHGCKLNGLNTKNNGFYFVKSESGNIVYKSGNTYYEMKL